MENVSAWVLEETKEVNFGDKRLNKRFGNILNNLLKSPEKSIPGACKSWGETIAAYRFFNHEEVNDAKILKPHQAATLKRIQQEEVVLIPQDTTEIDFTQRDTIAGMGYLSTRRSQGFYLHLSLAMTPERSCLGVVNVQTIVREKLGSRYKKKRNQKPIEEKESYCWLEGYEAAKSIALSSPNTTVVSIADRAGDIYELLEQSPSEMNQAYWLVRARHNRRLVDEEGNQLKQLLYEKVQLSEPIGEIEFELPEGKVYKREATHRYARQPRKVKQEIRSCTVFLKNPKKNGQVRIQVVHCCEMNAPTEEDKLEWLLLTSYPVEGAEGALNIVKWYLCRWQIEVFFKVLKSGCTIEKLQFESMNAIKNCLAIYLIVAWRILYLTMLGRSCPELDSSVLFEEHEWQSVCAVVTKKPPPKKPPKLNEMIRMIARLGGFLDRKSDGFPGAKVMWIGMQRMKDIALGWLTFKGIESESYV